MQELNQFTDSKLKILHCTNTEHKNEQVIAICLKKGCTFSSRLMCLSCLTSDHCDHGRFSIKVSELSQNAIKNEVLAMNWKGDADIPQKIIKGIKYFENEYNPIKVATLFDEFEKQILVEIQSIRKQMLSEIELKRQIGDNEKDTAIQKLISLLGIQEIKHILHENKEGENLVQSVKQSQQISEQITACISSSENDNTQQSDECRALLNNSESLFSQELDLNVISNCLTDFQKSISKISTSLQKNKELELSFQVSRAYDSAKSIKLKLDNREAIFSNLSSYGVLLLNRPFSLNDRPRILTFSIEPQIQNKHLCIGLRKESIIHEESYNKSPYKCLHCQIGDGVILDQGSLHNHIQNIICVSFSPKEQQLIIYPQQSYKTFARLSFPLLEKDTSNQFRLYFWRVGNNNPITIKLLKEEIL